MRPVRRPRPERLAVRGTLALVAGDQTFGGPARIALLRAVAANGSINAAAKLVGLSYKAAWDAIESMNRYAAQPLVERATGGRGGGFTRLTEYGQRLVERMTELERAHDRFVAALDRSGMDLAQPFSLLKVLNMQTSARNQWEGTITALRAGAVNDEVEITLAPGVRIVAIVTRESTASLALRVHQPVIALVKSSAVILATGLADAKVSADNRLDGVVTALVPGAVNAEVLVEAEGGIGVVAIVTQAAAGAMKIAAGMPVSVLVKPSDVILAVIT